MDVVGPFRVVADSGEFLVPGRRKLQLVHHVLTEARVRAGVENEGVRPAAVDRGVKHDPIVHEVERERGEGSGLALGEPAGGQPGAAQRDGGSVPADQSVRGRHRGRLALRTGTSS